jgi:PAS domain S-box-containing protein
VPARENRSSGAPALILSARARAIYGLGPSACHLKNVLWRVHPDERRQVRATLQAALRGGAPLDIAYRLVQAAGQERHVHVRAELLRTDDGRAPYLGTVEDVSGKHTAEQDAARSATRLSATLESITDALYTLDREWRFTFLNREAERLFRRRRAQLLGKVLWGEFAALQGQIGYCEFHRALRENRTVVFEHVDDTIAKMNLLKEHGLSFALDDFGTGYSSLAYLKQLPLNMLKIDRSFVLELLTNRNDAVIARTIIALGRSLGLRVLAEGVETIAQRGFLFEHGCDAYQGYLYARALPAGAVTAVVCTSPPAPGG